MRVLKHLDCPITGVRFSPNVNELLYNRSEIDSDPSQTMLFDIEYSLNQAKCFDVSGMPARYTPDTFPKRDYPYLFRQNLGCKDPKASSLYDITSRLGTTTELELYQENSQWDTLFEKNFLYEHFVNLAGNRMFLHSYHSLGFDFVAYPVANQGTVFSHRLTVSDSGDRQLLQLFLPSGHLDRLAWVGCGV